MGGRHDISAQPHNRTTAQPHNRTTAQPLNRTTRNPQPAITFRKIPIPRTEVLENLSLYSLKTSQHLAHRPSSVCAGFLRFQANLTKEVLIYDRTKNNKFS
jgi:hypothetical protein